MEEEWKPLKYRKKDFTGLYLISNLGRVKNLERNKLCRIYYNSDNRAFVSLVFSKGRSNAVVLSHAVWHSFNGKVREGFCAKNKDGNRKNNRLDNLELINRRRVTTRRKNDMPLGVTASPTKGKFITAIRLKSKVHKDQVVQLGTYTDPLIAGEAYELALKMTENNKHVTKLELKAAVSLFRESIGISSILKKAVPIVKDIPKKPKREGFKHKVYNF